MSEKVEGDIEVNVVIKWKCPKCDTLNEGGFSLSPYEAALDGEEGLDEMCSNCSEHYTII